MARHAITIIAIAAIILAAADTADAASPSEEMESPPKTADAGLLAEPIEFTVLTYNTHLFYGSAADDVCELCNELLLKLGYSPLCDENDFLFEDETRAESIAGKIAACGADIVALQEVWAPFKQQWFAQTLSGVYPHAYFVDSSCGSYFFGTDTLSNGVVLLSKWPLTLSGFTEFPTFSPSCFVWESCENWANKGLLTATADIGGPIRIGVSHALTGPDDQKSKWEPDYVANSITSFQLNGEAYIFALKKDNTGHIVRMEDYGRSWHEKEKKYNYGAGWKEVYKGSWSSDYRAVVSFELNGHPYLFSLKSGSDQAYVTRIKDDPSTGWQTYGPYSWDKDFRPTAITSFQLNGQAYIFGLKTTWDQAWFFRIKTDPSTGEFNSSDPFPFEVFGDYSWNRWFGAITSFESNGRPWLYCLKSNFDQVYINRINEDPSTGKLNRTNPFTIYGPFTQGIDRDFIGETITSYQLNGQAYIFGLKSGWDQAWLYRINPDPSTGLVSLGWKPWTRDYVAVESFEMNGHPYLFALRNCCEQLGCAFIPGVPVPLYPSQCDACERGLPGESYLKRINDDPSEPNKWEDLYQLEDIKIIRDQTVVDENAPAIMMGDFNIHRGKYGIMDQLFRKAGAVDAYIEVHGTAEGGETADWVENRLYQYFWPDANVADPDSDDRIDYVYVKPSGGGLRLVLTEAYVIRDWKYYSAGAASDMDLSDHYPLVVKFRLDPGCPLPLKGDFDCDHVVGFPDLAILCSAWLSGPGGGAWDRACDISDPGDDFIGMKDFDAFASQWGSMLVHNVTQNTWHVHIQTAINDANDGDEIVVAPGTYHEAINFKGKAIYLHSSDGPEATILDATGLNASVVICTSGEKPDSILEDFTLTGGNGTDISSYLYGGGMYNQNSSPTVNHCIFTSNSVNTDGGGMFNGASNPVVTDCIFSNNTANRNGGAMYNASNSNPTVTRCTFAGNKALSADYGGGGMFNNNACNPTVKDCIFRNNTAIHNAGGMYNITNSSPTVTNCIFTGNQATFHGGGICNVTSSSPTLTNCVFSGNEAGSYGGGMINSSSSPKVANCSFIGNSAGDGGGMWNESSNPIVTNCILWDDTPDEISNNSSSPTVTYSDVQGGYSGAGNINADPCLVNAIGGDLRLKSGSPCIDKGSNAAVPSGITTDLDGNPRVLDGDSNGTDIVDMGAYEYMPGALSAGSPVNLEACCILAANWLEAPWPHQP